MKPRGVFAEIRYWFDPSLIGKGFMMGCADIIPGVSGGTIAFITGIYERLINAIRSFDLEMLSLFFQRRYGKALARGHWAFVIQLAVGLVAAVLVFTKIFPIPAYIERYPQLVYGLFFGLIAGSVVLLMRGFGRLRWADVIPVGLGFAGGLAVVTLVPVATPNTGWFLILSGVLAISAGLLPGVSGSFVLLVLGKYVTVLSVLAPFALGCAVGLLGVPRLIGWLLDRYHRTTILIITGVLSGSLYGIWPFRREQAVLIDGERKVVGIDPYFPEIISTQVSLSFALMALGVFIVLVIGSLSHRKPVTL